MSLGISSPLRKRASKLVERTSGSGSVCGERAEKRGAGRRGLAGAGGSVNSGFFAAGMIDGAE